MFFEGDFPGLACQRDCQRATTIDVAKTTFRVKTIVEDDFRACLVG